MKSITKIFLVVISIVISVLPQTPPQNLLVNGGFENGFNGWSSSAILDGSIKYSGNYSARFTNAQGMIDQIINVQQNTEYKVTFWIYLQNNFTGSDWGGALCEVLDNNWNSLGSSIFISPENRPRNQWIQFAIHFNSGPSSLVRLQIGFFGGNGWNASFNIDEVKLFVKNQTNLNPVLTNFSVSPNSGSAPLTVNMSIAGYDIDGVVEGFYFQTSDGSFYEGEQATHIFYSPGNHSITGFLRDDDGGIVSATEYVTVSGSQNFVIQLTSPFQGDYFETDQPSLNIQGTLSSPPNEFLWFNEKNHQSGNPLLNGNNFSFNLPLRFGKNEIILQAKLPNNIFYKKEFTVYRKPANYDGPILGNVIFSSNQVGTFEKLEIEFDLNSVADNYWFPYEENLPSNLNTGKGVTVDCIFTKGNKVITFPAFYDMPYQRFNNYLLPTGRYVWKVRASFDEPGQYSVTLVATDSLGTKTYSLGNINVVQSENKGYLKVSEQNNKYFEYSTGSSFLGLGFNDGTDTPQKMDFKVNTYSQNGINLLRIWLSSISQFSDPWCAWTSHHQMTNNGYMNPPLYRFNRRYKNGDFSIRIASPAINDLNTPAVFRGFYDGGTNIKPNTNYRITIRYKLENVVGNNGGFSLKISGWAGTDIVNLNVGNRVYGPVKGSTDWIIGVANYTSSGNETELPFLYAVLEGDVTGEAYIDMILLQEVFPDGSLSENIMSKWSANPHYYLDPIKPRYFDYFVDKATNKNVHFKVVIFEKDDYILNHIDPGGYPSNYNGSFDAPAGSKLRRLYEYYWRNIIARWGYSDAIHSFELVNEGAPGSYFELVNDFSDYFNTHSPYQKLTTTSFWAMWVPEYWSSSNSDYGDVHAYAMTTGFLNNGTFAGQTYNREQMKNDPAALAYIYSKHIGNDPLRNKPVIIGETDFDMPGDQAPDPDLALDTQGIWLRGYLWGHLNDGGVSGLFWNPDNLRNNNLYHVYKPVSTFFKKIPFNRYHFKDADVQISNADVRGWGIAEESGNQVYYYSSHKNFYWRYVLNNGMPAQQISNYIIRKLIPGNYRVIIYNTNTGDELQSFNQVVGSDSTLTLNSLTVNPDIAFSIVNRDLVSVEEGNDIPTNFEVFQNYPNPFNNQTKLQFNLPYSGDVTIEVFDILGNRVKYDELKNLSAGKNYYKFTSDNLSSGVYLVSVSYTNSRVVKKIMLLK
ncbi:T9SS type A sorting domain-containing protein [Ignavibacterium sp.]|uniref:T9SS type A sorting domain-containing protein n=1 Tax=Ignavibacterium sp. TaxID=2651167 RepID=UPI002205988D|nr:T9SS type A sorting domain-containing protein [Ignavibacterium sp.]BDQ03723.1 MAG: hypothetical protein KatS3mg037_2298 [Ignavibacterium sp.]